MPDDVDPPRRHYGFRRTEIERLNPLPASSGVAPNPPASPPAVAGSNENIVREERAHPDVFALLKLNRERAEQHEPVPVLSPWYRRQRRLWSYVLALIAVDLPLAIVAYFLGHENALLFVPLVGAIAYFTAWLTWQVWVVKG